MVKSCCATGCHINAKSIGSKEKKISFHHLPKDSTRLKLWLKFIKRNHYLSKKNSFLCSAHFLENCFTSKTGRRTLRKDAIPTVRSNVNTLITRKGNSRNKCIYDESNSTILARTNIIGTECNADDVGTDNNRSKATQTETDRHFSKVLKELKKFKIKNKDLNNKLKTSLITVEYLKEKGEKYFKNMTGFTSLQFYAIFDFFCLDNSLLKKSKLNAHSQFLLTVIKLRQGISNNLIALLFKISQSSVSSIFRHTILTLSAKCRTLDIWPSRQQVNAFMPPSFVEYFPACRVIIDTCHFLINQPKNPKQQQSSFSFYKNHNTVKALIGISPGGAITFISKLYNGSISDKEITIRSGLLNGLEDGDCVLADRGFTVLKDLFDSKNVSLLTPYFLKNKQRFEIFERSENKKISQNRCHVERAIGRIKHFKFLKSEISYVNLPMLDDIYYVVCFLINFQDPLIKVELK